MSKVRYIIEFIPTVLVQREADKHAEELQQGASVWDFCEPYDLAQEREAQTERLAYDTAKTLLPRDEFGEVHVFEQRLVQLGRRDTWETFRRAVVWEESTSLEWQDAAT